MNENEQVLIGGIYEHYKGKRYRVLGVGRHTENEDDYVVYSPLYENDGKPDYWLRPFAMFFDEVEIDGVTVPRFRKLDQ